MQAASVGVSFVVREENKLPVLFTYNKRNSHEWSLCFFKHTYSMYMHVCALQHISTHIYMYVSPLSSLPSNRFRYISKDRFDRVLRYWARGPVGCEDTLSENPWAEVNWVIDGHNEKRRKEFRAGSRLTPDESMVTWTGAAGPGGMPHLSFIKRKPKPLGAEFKSVCDGSTGICLFLETQEGKVRMARKMFCK